VTRDSLEKKKNPYVFVVGCPRSGTTLLQRMLDSHPQLAVANDTHFIIRMIRDRAEIDPELTPKLIKKIIQCPPFSNLEIPPDSVSDLARGSKSYTEFIIALYTEYARIRRKALAGEKTPDYVKHLITLHQLFPWAKNIHIIRDGRDTTLSMLEWAPDDKGPARFKIWHGQPVAACAVYWKFFVSKGLQDGGNLGEKYYMDVRYEELVKSPEPVLRSISSFLDLPFSSTMLAYYEGKRRDDLGLSAKTAWLPPTPNLRDWQTQMSSKDLELFEAIAGDLLTSLGYERAFDRISSEVMALADRYENLYFKEEAEKKARRLERSK